MPFPVDFYACVNNPGSRDCAEARAFFRELLEAMYLARFISPPKPFPPLPGPFFGDLSPQPSVSAVIGHQNVLISELLVNALRDPTPTPMIESLQQSGIQREVAKTLLGRFSLAVKALEKEIEELDAYQG